MLVARVSSRLPRKELVGLAVESEFLLLDPKAAASVQSLKLAHHLAQSCFRDKTNLAKRFHLEFLLWLAGKKDINAALDAALFRSPDDILLVAFHQKEKPLLEALKAKKKPLGVPLLAAPSELERISLSRI